MISGGIKFFDKSKILDASVSSAINGVSSVSNLLNANKETFWRTIGSSDSVNEIVTISFSSSKTIDRIFLRDFNGKEFSIQYDVSGVWTNFTNVIGIDGSLASISETVFAQNTAYYEFDSVITTQIRIQFQKTQVVDAEKHINQVIATAEIATLVGYPEVDNVILERKLRTTQTLSGKFSVQKSIETFRFKLAFKTYPASNIYNVDIDAMLTLQDSENPFLVWLCGGRYEQKFFTYALPGFRLKDIAQVQVRNAYSLKYITNVYTNPVNLASVQLVEHI